MSTAQPCQRVSQFDAEMLLDAIGHGAKYSAGYPQARNPRRFDVIALAVGYGLPVSIIATRCGVGGNTVSAVSFAAARSLEDSKQALRNNLRKRLHGGDMILAERLDEIPVEKLLLDGQGTSSTRPETAGTLEAVAVQICEAQEAARQPKGRAIEEAPGTGSGLANNFPLGMALADCDPIGQQARGKAVDREGSAGANGKPPADQGSVSQLKSGKCQPLSGALYQSGQDGSHGSHEDGRAVDGGGGGVGASRGQTARHIKPR